MLYSAPTAKVCTNNSFSTNFPLSRGMGQGCLLSPDLFALALEPLAVQLHAADSVKGVQVNGIKVKLSLFAYRLPYR